ncbi:secreted aspartic proteinase precursor [Neofusicoccum parvum]|uniref:Putative a chain endothiapepsin n=1 Tax=Botryosphaeria parva (strain UCR-NP2) TaxID=1287680 RepID=R1ESA5_BOTPV|nr:putative a chain endothiapepsin [Neofusicoccum parvum UCRNP2]GME59308.1 secreted aspartic proteinase precursor [Neofusicoccum parvum]
MPSLSQVAIATLLATAGSASVIPPRIGVPTEGTASLVQVRNTKHVKSGPYALAKAYRKYGVPISEDLQAAVNNATGSTFKRATGSATTTPTQYDSEYLTPVSIGTPAQVLNLDFDTGSSDLWVFSSETPSNEVSGQTQYNPSKSSTASKLSGATWKISYGDGSSSSGDVYKDKVTVGGLTVTSQAVELAKTVSDEFTEDTDNDGLLGLAFSSLNTVSPTQQKTFFDNAKSSLTSPLFTADLKHNAAGKYNFGYIDSSAYTGSITYASISTAQGWWQWTSSGYAVGSATFKSTSINGIADTGTTLLLLPDSVVSAYYAKVSGSSYSSSQGGYVFPCSATLPSFTFGVGSARITIPGTYMNYAPVTSSSCYGGIQSNSDIGFTIFGDIALKAAFVVFNGGTNQIGWASKSV